MMQQSLSLGLLCVAFSALIELLVYYTPLWQQKRVAAIASLIFLGFGAGYLAANFWWPFGVLLLIISAYKGFSLLRLVQGRSGAERLRATGKKTFFWLTSGLLALIWLVLYVDVSVDQLLTFIALGSLLLSLIFAFGVSTNLVKSRPSSGEVLTDSELPTVTIAIPARNETVGLEPCLLAALASDYPKLEILVLDDCSQDKTAETIKSFAHDGVRFVLGEVSPDDWLAKNHAYDQLLSQASGKYVLFMGVDVRLHSTSVRSLVQIMAQNKYSMISILPRRTKSGLASAFVQPMRYFWELALPSSFKKWPPVLSTCWIIERKAAEDIGGFKSVKHAILPERHFASTLGKRYGFKRTSHESLISTHKNFKSQWSTAIRTRYPQLHRRPELVALQTIGLLAFVLAPFLLIFVIDNGYVKFIFIVSALLLTIVHVAITTATNKAALWLAPLNIFFVVTLDVIALNVSMYLYEFSEVLWKGRNACLPILQTVQKLPKI